MAEFQQQLADLKEEILSDDTGARHSYAPKLATLMDQMEAQGQQIPADIRCLHEELVNEAIEAQFDNMPV